MHKPVPFNQAGQQTQAVTDDRYGGNFSTATLRLAAHASSAYAPCRCKVTTHKEMQRLLDSKEFGKFQRSKFEVAVQRAYCQVFREIGFLLLSMLIIVASVLYFSGMR